MAVLYSPCIACAAWLYLSRCSMLVWCATLWIVQAFFFCNASAIMWIMVCGTLFFVYAGAHCRFCSFFSIFITFAISYDIGLRCSMPLLLCAELSRPTFGKRAASFDPCNEHVDFIRSMVADGRGYKAICSALRRAHGVVIPAWSVQHYLKKLASDEIESSTDDVNMARLGRHADFIKSLAWGGLVVY